MWLVRVPAEVMIVAEPVSPMAQVRLTTIEPASEAVPSVSDLQEASDGAPVMLIVALVPAPVVRAFVLEKTGSKEIRIVDA